jgi:hypothetical protein
MIQIVLVASGTSAFAERTFSMAWHLKTWLHTSMKDERFCNLSILGWYADELDNIVDFVKLGNNDFVQEGRDEQRQMFLGKFTAEDFKFCSEYTMILNQNTV